MSYDAYLDIETTGLAWPSAEITVIGIYLVNGRDRRFVQLVGRDVTRRNLLDALRGAGRIITYNGSRFDLPFISQALGANLVTMFGHRDLMYDCWRCQLYGGFKVVEQHLGVSRRSHGVDGLEAVRLWYRYRDSGDLEALDRLLLYNKEDVINLKHVRDKLDLRMQRQM